MCYFYQMYCMRYVYAQVLHYTFVIILLQVTNIVFIVRYKFFYSSCSTVGTYFGTHFIMGGERFQQSEPQQYLFGENTDLNFLGGRPTPVSKIISVSYILDKLDGNL